MPKTFLTNDNLPFCSGCSHSPIARQTEEALQKIGVNPLDVILVTDIGCHGIIDSKFHTHTVHGLHGRSMALASGIAAALSDPSKKVIVFIGDGGATIGVNHLIAAAHRNFDITVVLHNNMLYGMTGGQPSDLTPCGFKTRTDLEGPIDDCLDMVSLTKSAGGAYASRIKAVGDFSDSLAEAFQVKGFSLIEILELCPSYGIKHNKDVRLKSIESQFNLSLERHHNKKAKCHKTTYRADVSSLLDGLKVVAKEFEHGLKEAFSLLIGGSAGKGAQSAADIFIKAALSCGLNVTKKGSYPVTVGTGYSAVEVILSPEPIQYTWIQKIDWALVSSADGLSFLQNRLKNMSEGFILADNEFEVSQTKASVLKGDFLNTGGAKEINLLMLLVFLNRTKIFSPEAFLKAISESPLGKKIDVQQLVKNAEAIQKEFN